MEERKGDARVAIISGVFFACIVAGGVFLFLYILLPESQSKPWYPIAGMALVAIPWAFWIMTCFYRCFRPANNPISDSGHYAKAGSSRACSVPAMSSAASARTAGNSSIADFSGNSHTGDRHVQFAGVVVMGDEDDQGGHGGQNRDEPQHSGMNERDVSECSADSERPLRLMV